MVTVVTLDRVRPPARYDDLAWTEVRFQQAVTATGPWTTLETIVLSPVDLDPATPAAWSFTTELATLDAGWYRLTFVDATGDTAELAPVRWPLGLNYLPTVDDVALLLRTRTMSGVSTGLGGDTGAAEVTTFNATTRPSASEVSRIIDTAYGFVSGDLTARNASISIPAVVPIAQAGRVSHAVAVYAAILIELSFFREQNDAGTLAMWREMYTDAIGTVTSAISAGSIQPAFGMITIRSSIQPVGIPPSLPLLLLDDEWWW